MQIPDYVLRLWKEGAGDDNLILTEDKIIRRVLSNFYKTISWRRTAWYTFCGGINVGAYQPWFNIGEQFVKAWACWAGDFRPISLSTDI